MYIIATTTKYEANTEYYTKSGDTYTLFTNYSVGDTITGTKYEKVQYDKIYVRKWGSSDNYKKFPYKIGYESTLPEHDISANDVDKDAYTNTKGYTIRNRVRENVGTIEMTIPTMSGEELHGLFQMTNKKAWLEVMFFYEPSWKIVNKKMYRNGTIKYHRYYMDSTTPNNNIYTDISWGVVEQ